MGHQYTLSTGEMQPAGRLSVDRIREIIICGIGGRDDFRFDHDPVGPRHGAADQSRRRMTRPGFDHPGRIGDIKSDQRIAVFHPLDNGFGSGDFPQSAADIPFGGGFREDFQIP